MRKIGWTVIAVILIMVMVVFFYFNREKLLKKNEINEEKLYDLTLEEREILPGIKHDKDKFVSLLGDLQTIPYAFMDLNCKIMKLSYKLEDKGEVGISDENLKILGDIQRLYYSDDLLDDNSKKEYFDRLLSDVRKWNENRSFIIDYEIKEPIIITGDDSAVNVRFVLNGMDSKDIYQQYLIKEYEGKWYIEGWRGITQLEYEKNE